VTAGQSAFQIGQGTTVSVAVTRDGGAVTPSAVAWTATGAGSVTFADATVSPASVTGASAGAVTLTASVTVDGTPYTGSTTVTVTAPPAASSTRVSEFHYDNEGADEGEAIEVEGEAGQSLAGWSLVLYNRTPGSTSAQVYLTIALSGTFANQCSGRGTLTFPVPATPGLQNGTNDGFALVNASNQVVELLSYEGSFTATEGPAAGLTAVNVGVEEGSSTQSTQSLQRGANGAWYGPANETFGRCNPATAPSVAIEGYSFRGGDPIPVGFGELYRFKDVASNTFIRTGVTWSTADPAIATVDALGNVTATAPGETFVTATETATGRTASQRVRVVQFAPVDESVYADELQFGVPTDADPGDDLLVNRATFAASWSAARGQPNWVAYNLEQTHRTGAVDRCDCFAPDPLLPAGTPAVYSSDYDGSGFSRGHMTMSADRTRGALDNAQTFYFTNIIPQTSANNGGPWLQLENYLGSQAASGTKEIFVFAGGAAYSGTLNGAGRVAIPTRTWKVAVILDRNEGIGDVLSPADVEVIAVDMPNTATVPSGNWQDYRTSVDAIEALTGYDLLSALPDPIEQVIEARRAGVQQVAMNLGPEQLSVTGTSVVTVTLFSETGFDASATNAADLRLVTQTGAVVAPLSRGGVVTTTVRDMNGDGLADRNLSFSMSALRAAGFSQSARQLVLRPAAAPVWEAFDLTPPSVNP
jgi:endonuclease G